MASRKRHSQKHDEDDHTEETSKKSRHVMRNAKGKATTQDNMGDEPSETSASKGSLSKRPPRGPTSMHCLSIQRVEGVKKDVELNLHGQPIGENAIRMQSYIGVLAREKVSITHKSWKDVSEIEKELIWESLNLVYNIDPTWKTSCLESANAKWRQYKTLLTNEYVFGRMNSPDLNTPPPGLGIEQSVWSEFVISRMSEDFIKLREKQKQRRKSNKYPYRLSRKGYARYAEEIPQELGDDPEINRAILWVKGRLNREGNHEVMDKELYIAQQKELLESKKKNEEMDARIKRLEALFESKQPFNESFTDEKGSCSVKMRPLVDKEVMDKLETHGEKQVTDGDDDDLQMVSEDEALQGKLVGLKMELGADIAAYGTIIKVDAPKNCIRVSIDQAVDENAVLPIPMDDCQSIGEAVGSHVSWPMHLIKLSDVNSKRKKAILSKNVKTLDPSTVPSGLHMLYCYSKMSLSHKGNIMITLPQNVFGHERTLYVNFEDIEAFCHLKPISYTCIAVYIWYLYTRLERENKLKRFRFVDPYGVGYVAWTKKGKDALNEQTEERARSLANRLIGTLSDQIVVVPCNVGEHWILTVIDPHKEHVYILDPLYTRIKDESWKKAVDLAIKMFNVDVQRKGRKQVKWEIIRGPSQPDAYQCGFYVMRYMRQLVDLDVSVDLDSLQLRFTQEEYSKEEIDEVRSEWATCVQRHVQEY